MINQLLIEEVFSQPWCIDKQYAQSLAMAVLASITSGKPVINNRYERYSAVNPQSGTRQSKDFAPGSVGLVVIDGPIVANSEPLYGIKGTLEAAKELYELDTDPNIIGSVLYMESGGGAVYAIKPMADILSGLKKPVVVFSKHILASAAYRLAANTSHIMMYHPQGIVGSIGTMSSFSDIQPMFEKLGMKFHEYYATLSTLKNKTFNDAKNGDPEALIKNILDPMNELFIADIKTLRGDLIDKKEESIFKGETFMAERAKSLGLIDSIGEFSDAVAKVVELAQNPSHKNFNQKSHNMFGFNKFSKLSALAKVAANSITADQVKAVNEEIVAEGIEGVTLVLDSELETVTNENKAASEAAANLKSAQEKITSLEAEIKTANDAKAKAEADLATMTSDRDGWKTKAEEFGDKPADEPTAGVKNGSDNIEGTNNASDQYHSEADEELAQARVKAGITKK